MPELAWAHSIEDIFRYFDNYFKIIKEFKDNNPNFIYELQYEKFINDPQTESKKLINFCDLTWDEKCLQFYKRTDLISKTASNLQIRKSIFKNSGEKYLPYKKIINKYGQKYSWYK